jgi:hypothetical protein
MPEARTVSGARPLIGPAARSSRASRANRRLSAARATTRSPVTSGTERISLDTRVRQRCFPDPASSATISPSRVPIATRLPSLPTPAESTSPVPTRQDSCPVVASKRATVPSCPAAKTPPAATAGKNTPSPASPTLASHSVRMGMFLGRSESSAIIGPDGPEHPARNIRPANASRRISLPREPRA